MQHPLAARREAKPAGVVDTLSAGYAALNRQLWVLLVPILVDVFLWLGPQVSLSPLVDPFLTHASELVRQAEPASPTAARSAALATDLDEVRRTVIAYANDVNALGLLAHGPLAVPSAIVALGGIGAFAFVDGWLAGLGLLGATLVAGLLLGGMLRSALAQQVSEGRSDPFVASRRTPLGVARVLGLLLLLLGVGALLGLPLLVVVSTAALVAPPLATVGAVLLAVGTFCAELYLFFAVDAIFVSGVGPLAAVRRSVAVVRQSLWPTLGLILLTWVILAGMDRVWELLARTLQAPFGTALGVLGNAYIATGLLAASMIFYKQRADLVLKAPAAPVSDERGAA